MGEICGLKFHLIYVHASQNFLLKSLHAQKVSFLLHREVDLCKIQTIPDSFIRPYQDAAAGFTQRARERAQQYKPPHVPLLLS